MPDIPLGPTAHGDPDYLTRPLSDMTTIPGRGAPGAHNVDTDVKPEEYISADVGDIAPWDSEKNNDGEQLWVDPHPLLVKVVQMPSETEEKRTAIRNVKGQSEFYVNTGLNLVSGAGPDFPKDDSRTSLTLTIGAGVAGNTGGGQLQYGFAISTDPSFSQYSVLCGGAGNQTSMTILGKNAIYIALFAFNAYAVNTPNFYVLNSVAEYQRLTTQRFR